jgi:hypothetical protein
MMKLSSVTQRIVNKEILCITINNIEIWHENLNPENAIMAFVGVKPK